MTEMRSLIGQLAQQYDEALRRAVALGCQICGAPVTTVVGTGDLFEAEFDPDGTMWAKITSRVQLRCDDHREP